MCRQKIKVLLLCAVLCVLCGCTRREQLTLEVNNEVNNAAEAVDETEGTGEDGQPVRYAVQESAQTQQGGGLPEDAGQVTAGASDTGTSGQKVSGKAEAGDMMETGQEQSSPDAAVMICVHVCGAVKRAGVYELPAGSRVYEAVKCAGGFSDEADEDYVNQAQRLSDGSKLVIPTIEQAQSAKDGGDSAVEQIGIVEQDDVTLAAGHEMSSEADGSSDGRININTASEAQLCEIPGIGATRAAAIVAYRQESGGFRSIEDIMNVSGIKEGTYAKIKDSIKVN